MADQGTQKVTLLGTTIPVKNADDPQIRQAVEQTQEYINQIREATNIVDDRTCLLVALLNRTMELEQMKQPRISNNEAVQQQAAVWARELNQELQKELSLIQ